jgi:DsbC/DsbD-like thiol-disulfide interchange protein/cytochrome c biogenesis protein CcdA
MRILRLIFLMLLLLSVGLPAPAASNAADAPHVRVQLVVSEENLIPGTKDENNAGLYFKLEAGWHIYWMNPGDAGEPPHVQWTLPVGITAGPLRFPAPKRLPLGPLMDYGYEGEVYFPVMLNVAKSLKPGPVTLHAKVNWLVCREVCIPGKAELEVSRRVGTEDDLPGVNADFGLLLDQLKVNSYPEPFPANAKAVFQPASTGIRLSVETGKREPSAVFFPSDPDILDNPSPQKLTPTPNGLILDLKKDTNLTANPTQLKGVLELSGGRAYEIAALPPGGTAPATALSASAAAPSTAPSELSGEQASSNPAPSTAPPLSLSLLLRTSGLAFLGGVLLNLMPCVFPVLFLKGLALVNSGNEERQALRMHGMVYATGILVSFWALVAVLLGLRAAGATLGWGFQFQSPVFLALMAGLLFFLGLSLAGQFEIGLTLTSAGGSVAAKQGYTGSFFTGVLAVVVATPCTAPFMGAAVGYALSQSSAVTFAVFTALALGLAAPYVALTLATSLDAPAAQARRMDGSAASGRRSTHLCYGHLAGLGAGRRLRERSSRFFVRKLSVAGYCGVVPGPLAGQTLVRHCCSRDSVRSGRSRWLCSAKADDRIGGSVPSRDARTLAAVVGGSGESLTCGRAAGLCGLHGKLVSELPGE